ncbi:MAG: glycerol kinase, partial [Deltaproteobacteria bacterium]|nr:glycerol kinase [Deltaproteobacteria bacterium]
MPSLVLALDQGTTSSRAILFDAGGQIRGSAQREFRQIFPKAGWVEHDPEEIWQSQIGCVSGALAQANAGIEDVAALGITNQRETTIVWDRKTGAPIHNAIVWQDRRTAEECDRLKAAGVLERVRTKTGLVLDAYFSGTKIAWILDHVEGARARAEKGELAFGTVDTWLVWKLTQGAVHATDATNASRTLLYDLHTGTWDDELLGIFRVPRAMLPEIKDSSAHYGEATTSLGPVRGVPIGGIAGDQQAALFGQACLKAGMAKNTYGTGCFLLQDIGDKPITSTQGLLTTVARKLAGKTSYALEGSVFIGGAVVQWMRDGLGIIHSASEVEALANSVPDSGGVMLVPAFAGLGAPHWDPYARGLLIGMTRGTTKAHLARAGV